MSTNIQRLFFILFIIVIQNPNNALLQAIAMYKEGDYTPEALRNLKIGYETLFIEVPIVIRNSPLTNIMMSELGEMIPEEEGSKFLDLGTASVLEGESAVPIFNHKHPVFL